MIFVAPPNYEANIRNQLVPAWAALISRVRPGLRFSGVVHAHSDTAAIAQNAGLLLGSPMLWRSWL